MSTEKTENEKLKSPFGATCETCPFWHKPLRRKYCQASDGTMVPADTAFLPGNLPMGVKISPKGQIDVAPCTLHPQYFFAPITHWCWQHPAARKSLLQALSSNFTLNDATQENER